MNVPIPFKKGDRVVLHGSQWKGSVGVVVEDSADGSDMPLVVELASGSIAGFNYTEVTHVITVAMAARASEVHYGECTKIVGPRGGIRIHQEVWRANGMVQTWKTRPSAFRLPIKHGLKEYSQLTPYDATSFHLAEECPIR